MGSCLSACLRNEDDILFPLRKEDDISIPLINKNDLDESTYIDDTNKSYWF